MPLLLCQSCFELGDAAIPRPSHSLESRFSDSSYAPSDAEVAQLKSGLAEEEEELGRYEDEIRVLRQKLEKLEEEEQHLRDNVKKRRSAVSVQRRIPVEIWETVFAVLCTSSLDYSLDIDRDYTAMSTEDAIIYRAPTLTLSHVCARWRKIVNGCPRFWSSISIQLTTPTNIIAPLKTYLERSDTHPLSLRVSLSLKDMYDSGLLGLSDDILDVWKVLGPHFVRTRELVIGLAYVDLFPRVHDLAFPNLVSFQQLAFESIGTQDLLGPSSPSWFWDAIHGASQLRNVIVEGVLPHSSLPYHQLEHLTIHFLCGTDSAELLFLVIPHCTSLTSLTIGSPDLDDDDPLPPVLERPIIIPTLRHLTFDNEVAKIRSDSTFFQKCCPKMELPALTSFTISCSSWPPALSELLQRCAATLKKVDISVSFVGGGMASPSHILTMLYSLSNVTHLRLAIGHGGCGLSSDAVVIRDAFRGLLSRLSSHTEAESPSSAFLPKLQSVDLTFSDVELTTEMANSVLDVVSSRLAASMTCPLTHFRFARRDSVFQGSDCLRLVLDRDTLDRLKGLREDRVHVVFDNLLSTM